MALPLPSSSPAPGIAASKTGSKPCNRYEKQEGEVVGITKLVPPDEGRSYPLSRIWDYLSGRATLFAGMVTGAHAQRPSIFLDSGARFHTTDKFELLHSFIRRIPATALDAGDGNGRRLQIEGVGSLACHGFCIPSVHYVTGLAHGQTLVSVQQLAGCGYRILFGGGRCYVKDGKDGSLVGEGRLHKDDGSYQLEFLQIPLEAHQGSSN